MSRTWLRGRHVLAGCGIVVLVAVGEPAGARGAELLRLADAVREALARSAVSSDARDAVAIAEGGRNLSRAGIAPQISFDALGAFGRSTLANQQYGTRISQQFTTGTEVRAGVGAFSSQNQLGTFYLSSTTLQVTQPLLRGFGGDAVRRDLALADLRLEDARRRRLAADEQVALAVASAYYRIVTQGTMVDVADQALARARALVEAAEARLALGHVSKLDVLRAQQLVVQSDLQALDARAAAEQARDDLRGLLRRDATFDFTVEPAIPPIAAVPPLEELVQIALARRIDVETASAAVREAALFVAAASDAARPQVDLTLQMTRHHVADSLRASFGLDAFQMATFAGVSVPLDRTPSRTNREAAAIRLTRAERELELVRLRVGQDVRAAWRDLERLRRTLEQAGAAVGFAEQEVELATLRHQRGLSNNLDVVTAEGHLLNARALRFRAMADAAIAQLRLKAAAGLLDPATEFR